MELILFRIELEIAKVEYKIDKLIADRSLDAISEREYDIKLKMMKAHIDRLKKIRQGYDPDFSIMDVV